VLPMYQNSLGMTPRCTKHWCYPCVPKRNWCTKVVYLKPKQLIIKDCARRFVLKLHRHEASRGFFATAELLVLIPLIFQLSWLFSQCGCRCVIKFSQSYSEYLVAGAAGVITPPVPHTLVTCYVTHLADCNLRAVICSDLQGYNPLPPGVQTPWRFLCSTP